MLDGVDVSDLSAFPPLPPAAGAAPTRDASGDNCRGSTQQLASGPTRSSMRRSRRYTLFGRQRTANRLRNRRRMVGARGTRPAAVTLASFPGRMYHGSRKRRWAKPAAAATGLLCCCVLGLLCMSCAIRTTPKSDTGSSRCGDGRDSGWYETQGGVRFSEACSHLGPRRGSSGSRRRRLRRGKRQLHALAPRSPRGSSCCRGPGRKGARDPSVCMVGFNANGLVSEKMKIVREWAAEFTTQRRQ